jgi:hypothetical protein
MSEYRQRQITFNFGDNVYLSGVRTRWSWSRGSRVLVIGDFTGLVQNRQMEMVYISDLAPIDHRPSVPSKLVQYPQINIPARRLSLPSLHANKAAWPRPDSGLSHVHHARHRVGDVTPYDPLPSSLQLSASFGRGEPSGPIITETPWTRFSTSLLSIQSGGKAVNGAADVALPTSGPQPGPVSPMPFIVGSENCRSSTFDSLARVPLLGPLRLSLSSPTALSHPTPLTQSATTIITQMV